MLNDYAPHIAKEGLRLTHATKLTLSTYFLCANQGCGPILLPIRRVRYVHHHVCMLLLVQSRQRYTLLDVCTVSMCIHAINVHGCLLTVDLQPVPPPDDEKSAMRAIVDFLADAHG